MPWRDIDDPYIVFVSEYMLQQTQASRVMDLFPAWIERFPTLPTLARARTGTVLRAWTGFGYNRRALHLHAAAKTIMSRFDTCIPHDPALLRTLPGIGAYAARAIACFGFGVRTAVVDVNVRRVLGRVTHAYSRWSDTLPEKDAWKYAEALLPRVRYYDWNQALMDLGALVCTARSPRCSTCPLATRCNSAHRLEPDPDTTPRSREIPRRIHRGRLVEALRRSPGGRLDWEAIGPLLREDYGEEHRPWLEDVVTSLTKDGLVVRERGVVRLP